PAGTVDPDEPGRLDRHPPVGRPAGQAAQQLGAEEPVDHLGAAAGLAHALGDLAADVQPEPAGAGCREGLQLEVRAGDAAGHAHHTAGLLLDVEAQLHAADGGDAQRAQVHPTLDVGPLGDVVRTVEPTLPVAVDPGLAGRRGLGDRLHLLGLG